jgi:hypothetical protein
VAGTLAVIPAVKAAIRELLAKRKIHYGMQFAGVSSKIAGVIEKHSIDTDITFVYRTGRVDTTVTFFDGIKQHIYTAGGGRVVPGKAEMLEVQQGIVSRNPFDSIKTLTPM